MTDYDWSWFKRSVFIDATPEEVFNSWITPSMITTWFLLRADFQSPEGEKRAADGHISEGDLYEWLWWNYDGIENGKILKLDVEARHLEFSFANDACTVIVDVEVRDGDTLLRLEQKDMPTDETNKRNLHLGCSQGWSFWMVNLKSWLEHGILLHDQESHHKNKDFGFGELINR